MISQTWQEMEVVKGLHMFQEPPITVAAREKIRK